MKATFFSQPGLRENKKPPRQPAGGFSVLGLGKTISGT
jgi:hypothetical protein